MHLRDETKRRPGEKRGFVTTAGVSWPGSADHDNAGIAATSAGLTSSQSAIVPGPGRRRSFRRFARIAASTAFSALLVCSASAKSAESKTAENGFAVTLPPPVAAQALLTNSPFGINTAFNPNAPDLEPRLAAMREAGIKWGRQDFTWKGIERRKGEYDWEPYDRLVEKCRRPGPRLGGGTRRVRPTGYISSWWSLWTWLAFDIRNAVAFIEIDGGPHVYDLQALSPT